MLTLRKISHRALFLASRTVYMTCCCGCCSALRPRYKRLVDHIFPASPQDGLVKTNMEKLVFYSLSSPEKLDRIGDYLFQKASRDIYRRRHGFVIIAMEAMDQLLQACHSQTLNLFVESFLKMVQKLLESPDPELQTLATQSFVRFANIEEDTPSYHRRYDFFVSKFAAMCHSNHADPNTCTKIRLAGIQGLQGVIRKTVSDDLVENIWEAQHMDKIVPSLLYNMQSGDKYETVLSLESSSGIAAQLQDECPPRLSEATLRELVGRAAFGHIRSVLRPVITHFDRHQLWVPNDFAIHTFKIIMFSVQAQYSYSVVETLMQHVDAGSARVRAARADVLTAIVAIAAADTVGPSVLEIINSLLTNLRASVARDSQVILDYVVNGLKESGEKLYQDALINALGEFADHLPDFQKIDIMMFIVSKIPAGNKMSSADVMLQSILMKSLLKVGRTYRSTELSRAFPAPFLEAVLRVSGAGPWSLLLQLLDRRAAAALLQPATVQYSELVVPVEKLSKQDLIFFSKQGHAIFTALYDNLQKESNSVENVEAMYSTLALMFVELCAEETVCDMLQLVLAIQQSALMNPVLSVSRQCQLHGIVVSLCALISHLTTYHSYKRYIDKIISARRSEAPHLLPPLLEHYDVTSHAAPKNLPYLMIDQLAVSEALTHDGVESPRVSAAAYSTAAAPHAHRHSWLEAGAAIGRDSLADIAPTTEVDSAGSSPTMTRQIQYDDLDEEYRMFLEKYNRNYRPYNSNFGIYHEMTQVEAVSVEALRRAASGPSEAERRDHERRKHSLNNTFRTATFDTLLALTQPKYEIKEKLEEIFNSISEEPLLPPNTVCSPGGSKTYQQAVPPHSKYLSELFLY